MMVVSATASKSVLSVGRSIYYEYLRANDPMLDDVDWLFCLNNVHRLFQKLATSPKSFLQELICCDYFKTS